MSRAGEKLMRRSGRRTAEALKKRLGGVSLELMERSRDQARTQRHIREALAKGAMTTSDIHSVTGMPKDKIFWYLMAMKKYGEVVEGAEVDGYYQYSLADPERKKQ